MLSSVPVLNPARNRVDVLTPAWVLLISGLSDDCEHHLSWNMSFEFKDKLIA